MKNRRWNSALCRRMKLLQKQLTTNDYLTIIIIIIINMLVAVVATEAINTSDNFFLCDFSVVAFDVLLLLLPFPICEIYLFSFSLLLLFFFLSMNVHLQRLIDRFSLFEKKITKIVYCRRYVIFTKWYFNFGWLWRYEAIKCAKRMFLLLNCTAIGR